MTTTNIFDLAVGDVVTFTEVVNYKKTLTRKAETNSYPHEFTVSRVDEKSWYTTKGMRMSYGTLQRYAKNKDFKIVKA